MKIQSNLKRAFTFLIIMLIMLTGCNQGDKVKVGYLVSQLEFYRNIVEKGHFEDKIRELGGEVITLSADFDDMRQIALANELMDQGVNVLVVNPVNMNTAAVIVREAHAKNIKVIAYDRIIRSPELDYYISFDNVKVGRLMAEYVTKIKPEGKYILLGGDKSDQNAILVKSGQKEVLEPFINSGKIKILYDIFVDGWSTANARFEINRFLDLSDELPDVILASSDGLSSGAILALRENDLGGSVLVTGQDAALDACVNIVNGYQVMTIYKPLKDIAYAAAELAFKLAKGENVTTSNHVIISGSEVPAVILEPQVVDAKNIMSTVVADGHISEQDLYE